MNLTKLGSFSISPREVRSVVATPGFVGKPRSETGVLLDSLRRLMGKCTGADPEESPGDDEDDAAGDTILTGLVCSRTLCGEAKPAEGSAVQSSGGYWNSSSTSNPCSKTIRNPHTNSNSNMTLLITATKTAANQAPSGDLRGRANKRRGTASGGRLGTDTQPNT